MSFLAKLWGAQPGDYFCIAGKSGTTLKEHWFTRAKFNTIDALLAKLKGRDIYFCPHGFTRASRRKEFAVDPLMLYSDLDEADPFKMKWKPTTIIESSPGRFVGLWRTNDKASEHLNKRMTYAVGGDHGGWDRTQLLRVPGTRNHKYTPAPLVRLRHEGAKPYSITRLENELPDVPEDRGPIAEGHDDILKKLKVSDRQALRADRITTATDRSNEIFRLGRVLYEAGATSEQAFDLLVNSIWNKWRDDHDKLRDDIERSWGKKISERVAERDKSLAALQPKQAKIKKPEGKKPKGRRGNWVPISEVEEQDVQWLIPGWIPLGEVTSVEGDPGVGKSFLMQAIAGSVCDGRILPINRRKSMPPARVLYFDHENSKEKVTRARLKDLGVKRVENYLQDETGIDLTDEAHREYVEDGIEETGAKMIVFDVLVNYLGESDSGSASEIRAVKTWLVRIAHEYNIAVVILRHLTKASGSGKAMYAGSGSMTIAGSVRSGIQVFKDPDNPDSGRVMASYKLSFGRSPGAWAFTIQALPATINSEGDEVEHSTILWGDESAYTADALVSMSSGKEEKGKKDETPAVWLEKQFKRMPVITDKRLMEMAAKRSYTEGDMRDAAVELNVVIKRNQRDGENWSLPKK